MGDAEVTKLVLVGNIPPELRSADLRAFFNEWVEGGRFCCFHYQHRQDVVRSGAAGHRCCLVRVKSAAAAAAFTRQYDGERWRKIRRTGSEHELACRCSVRLASRDDMSPTPAAAPALAPSTVAARVDGGQAAGWRGTRAWASEHRTVLRHSSKAVDVPENTQRAGATGYQTRRQKRESVRTGLMQTREAVVPRDLMPPPGLPQGNVGTPSKRIVELASACVVPPSVLKALGVELSSCSRSKQRQGEFNFDWTAIIGPHEDDEADTEEWDRVDALEGPVPSHINERADRLETEYQLYEENCEQVWEKGSSGLVFYTDDSHWDLQEGDFHERTADALDVVPGDRDALCDWEAGTQDPDSATYVQAVERRREREKAWITRRHDCAASFVEGRRRQREEVKALPPILRPQRSRDGPSHGPGPVQGTSSPHVDNEIASNGVGVGVGIVDDAFERDVRRGFAGQLCEKLGWRPGDGLGVGRNLGIVKGLVNSWFSVKGAVMPVKGFKESRRGIGFGGIREHPEETEDEGCSLESASCDVDQIRGCNAKIENRHASPLQSSETVPAVTLGMLHQEKEYFHIGSTYDEDAVALARSQDQRASGERPWLGSFNPCSMPQGEQGGSGRVEKVWWEDTDGEKAGKDPTRKRLMQNQLESHVFTRSGTLGKVSRKD